MKKLRAVNIGDTLGIDRYWKHQLSYYNLIILGDLYTALEQWGNFFTVFNYCL